MHRVFIQQRILPPYRLAFFQALSRSGSLEPSVVYGDEAPGSSLTSLADPPGVRSKKIANLYLGRGPAITYQRGIVAAFDPGRYDTLIYSLDPRVATNFGLIAKARRHGIPAIGWGHGIRPSGRFKNIYRSMADVSSAILLYTGQGKLDLAASGVDSAKMFVAWNSIDTAAIASYRDARPISERQGILYLGRMTAEKKASLLVPAFAKAVEALGPESRLYMVGKGPDRAVAEMAVRTLGIEDRVEFVPETYSEAEIALWMNRCWVSVSPGYIGLSAIHAFAYGLPMIAGDEEPHSPEVEALELGENGLFFRANDADDLSRTLIELRGDAARLDMMGAKARETGDRFSVEAMAEAFERAVAFAHGEGPPDA